MPNPRIPYKMSSERKNLELLEGKPLIDQIVQSVKNNEAKQR